MHDRTIKELAAGLQAGDFTSVELTRHFLERIEALDGNLNSFITVAESSALREAVPVPDPRAAGELEASVAGEVPDPAKPPPGCPFHPRCRLAEERCRTEEPPLEAVRPDHLVACHVVARRLASGSDQE